MNGACEAMSASAVGGVPRDISNGARRELLFPVRALSKALLLAGVASGAALAVVALRYDGWEYYGLPLGVRGYSQPHRLLRPSGPVGHLLGIAGTALMVIMQLYTVRKKLRRVPWLGPLPFWLELHIFCGVVGPVLITLHTSLKFNGVVSVAYWSMLLVVASGFVGRYLYVRIPKTIRGTELTLEELEERARRLRQELVEASLPSSLLLRIEAFEATVVPSAQAYTSWRGLLFGELRLRARLRTLRRAVRDSGLQGEIVREAIAVAAERALLLRRVAYLHRTRRLFELWHVFHRPLAYLMLVIVTVHVATALYFGYAFVGR